MTNEEQEDLTAELLATNQALVFIVRSIATLAEKEGIPREILFRTWLENGTEAMARLNDRSGCGRKPVPGTKTSSWRVPHRPRNGARRPGPVLT
jgi:hypothetical protein